MVTNLRDGIGNVKVTTSTSEIGESIAPNRCYRSANSQIAIEACIIKSMTTDGEHCIGDVNVAIHISVVGKSIVTNSSDRVSNTAVFNGFRNNQFIRSRRPVHMPVKAHRGRVCADDGVKQVVCLKLFLGKRFRQSRHVQQQDEQDGPSHPFPM